MIRTRLLGCQQQEDEIDRLLVDRLEIDRGLEAGEEPEATDKPVVIAELTTTIETMTVGEAVMRLDLADLPAMLFHNSAHGGLNMVYRRPDGNIGWVDPRDAT